MAQSASRLQPLDTKDRDVIAGSWKDRAEYDAWCIRNMEAMNRLAVTNPKEWERMAREIEAFHARLTKET